MAEIAEITKVFRRLVKSVFSKAGFAIIICSSCLLNTNIRYVMIKVVVYLPKSKVRNGIDYFNYVL